MDSLRVAEVCFADDVILASHCKEDLQQMLEETIAAFLVVGLDVGSDKTHWTSWPPAPGDIMT
eukprot:748169-Alexandrium_andersonii.AAC.1